ncbi:hypothetical protein ACVIGB_002015 [Bradyrhizobium sp. USDA 4341]
MREQSRAKEPKANKFWVVVNSGIFLWFLSACLVTVGGGYITNHQQCMRDADQLISRRVQLVTELRSRRLAFSSSVANLKKVQPPFGPGKQGSIHSDLAALSFADVQSEYWKVIERINFDRLPDSRVMDAQIRWLHLDSSRADKEYERFREPAVSPPTKPDEALKVFKKTVELQLLRDTFESDLDALAYSYEPDCTVSRTLGTALGYKPRIVRAAVSPMFELGDTSIILQEDIEAMDKREKQD